MYHSVHPSPFCWSRGRGEGCGGEPPTKFSRRGNLAGPRFLEGGCWEGGMTFFRGGGAIF